MKKYLMITLLLAATITITGQENEGNKGKVSAKIYSNFNYALDRDDPVTAFEVTRAYFGYSRDLTDNFFAAVKLDIGSPDDISEYSRLRRYAYFKNAFIGYRKNKLTAWVGLFDMLQFKTQEKFWGYRYIYKSYMDEYRFGPSADIGLGARYGFNKYLTADLILSNGEGYNSPQRDNTYKVGLGVTLTPLPGLTIRSYYAIFTKEIPQNSITAFIGYKRNRIRIAGEYIYQNNYKFNEGYKRYGYSAYSTFTLNEKWEFFARYDQLFSNILPEDEIPWNLANDGSALLGGVQFKPIKALNVSLNYQDWVEYAENGESEPYIFMNFEINF